MKQGRDLSHILHAPQHIISSFMQQSEGKYNIFGSEQLSSVIFFPATAIEYMHFIYKHLTIFNVII